MTPVLAHAADWLASLVFLAPVLVLAGWLMLAARRERRREGEGDEGAAPPEPPEDRGGAS